MQISIIAETKMVSIKGISLILEDLDLPKDLVAFHWLDNRGWEEKKSNGKIYIKDVNSINHYQHVLDAYNNAYAKIPEDQLPVRNSDLIEFVEDALINIDIMKASDEWEDFKTATNRA